MNKKFVYQVGNNKKVCSVLNINLQCVYFLFVFHIILKYTINMCHINLILPILYVEA